MRYQSESVGLTIFVLLFGSTLSRKQSYELIIEKISFDVEPDQRIVDGSNLYLMGRNRVVNGTVEFFEDLDNENYEIALKIYSDPNGTGNFRPLPYQFPNMNPCDALREYKSYLQPSLEPGVNTNFPIEGDVCPIPKGVYFFNDVEVKVDNFPNQVPRGFLKGTMTLYKNEKYCGVFEILCRVEDKIMNTK